MSTTMKANLSSIKKRRNYSEEFKRNLVRDFTKNNFSVQELSKLHHVNSRIIYRWIYKYSPEHQNTIEIVEMKSSSSKKLKDMEVRIKELERAVGQKQLYIDYMEKMMDIAKEEMGVDIKKNFSTQHSNGSEKTEKK
jgi:transposase-like protein